MFSEILILGILISLIFAEFTGFSPGGMVVAGYFVLQLQNPYRIFYTLAIALVTYGLVHLLGKVVILYGRRNFGAMIFVSFLLHWGVQSSGIFPQSVELIGGILAGIIARECQRQGIWQTLLSLGIVVGILAVVLLLLGHPVLGVVS